MTSSLHSGDQEDAERDKRAWAVLEAVMESGRFTFGQIDAMWSYIDGDIGRVDLREELR